MRGVKEEVRQRMLQEIGGGEFRLRPQGGIGLGRSRCRLAPLLDQPSLDRIADQISTSTVRTRPDSLVTVMVASPNASPA
jgi:hypothetical protein